MADVQSKATDWYTNLKNELGGDQLKSFLDKFASCTTEAERVELIYTLPEINKVIKVQAKKSGKAGDQCVSYREQGNQVFQEKGFRRALALYNQSVLLAPVVSEDNKPLLALALANRSAALLYLKQYQLCLADVQTAYDKGYPQENTYKLQEREGKCYIHLNMKAEALSVLQQAVMGAEASDLPNKKKEGLIASLQKQIKQCDNLPDHPPNKPKGFASPGHCPLPEVKGKPSGTIPVLTNYATVKYSEESGRGLVVEQDIEVGDVVVVEKPYTSTLLPGFAPSHCHHCCRRTIAPTPCLECSEAVFCDDKCRQSAWETYHKYECDILASVRDADVSLGHLAIKMVLKAGFSYIDEFEDKIKASSKDDPKTQGFNEQGVYDSTDYRTVYTLMNHTENRKTEDVLKYCLSAVYLLKCLEQTNYFQDDLVPVSKKTVVGGHILRHLQMLPCNAHEVSELAVNRANLPASVTMEIGSAIYPVLSLINHSCDPNVVRHSYGDTCVVHAIRNIPKGSEILDNYGVLCALTKCPERRMKLEPQYFFTCKCLACTDDYLQYQDLPTEVPVLKCDKCGGPVFLPLQGAPRNIPCSSCNFCHDLTSRVSALSKSDESFRFAMMDVLTNEKVDVNKQIPTLENHLQTMDWVVLRPWRDFNDCQEVLKQCYALNANHFDLQS